MNIINNFNNQHSSVNKTQFLGDDSKENKKVNSIFEDKKRKGEFQDIENPNKFPKVTELHTDEVIPLSPITEEKREIDADRIVSYENGDLYLGDVLNDVPEGQGMLLYSDGQVYMGSFKNGELDGRGRLEIPGVGIYSGSFKEGVYEGYGRMEFSNGDVYEGTFKNGVPHVFGKYISAVNQTIYEGQFYEGRSHGFGQLTFQNGAVYKGQFSQNQAHGEGKFTVPTGQTLKGTFNNGHLVAAKNKNVIWVRK